MRTTRVWILGALVALAFVVLPATAQATGSITGTVTQNDGSAISGVTVVVSELGLVEITDRQGAFTFDDVPEGSYSVNFSLGDNGETASAEVTSGGAAEIAQVVDWDFSFAETITVVSASRRRERIVEAPAAVTLVAEEQIEEAASTGQLAKVLEFTPGVEVTQSGIFDYNLNTRGFNSSLNRRVQPLIDGRDPTVPFLGSTEWQALGNMQDLASVELVRGPSSALYGANAFNGVLNLTTKAPADSIGGQVRLTAGEQETLRADLLWATELGGDWYFKLNANYGEGEDFTRDRRFVTEYPGLPREAGEPSNEYDSTNFGLRFDRDFENGLLLTLEGGQFESDGSTTVTGIGRVNVGTVERPWARFNLSGQHFNVLSYFNGRESPNQLALASGGRIFLDTENRNISAQTNWDWKEGKVRLVAGASYEEEEIDSRNDQGFQTLVFAPRDEDFTGVFAQIDFDLSDDLKLVLAGRWDDSSLHDSQVSPKAALVWSVNSNNTFRFSYNEAFQVANYSEFFLDAPTAFPAPAPGLPPISQVDLSGIEEAVCTPFGVTCGFGSPVRVRALGNANLDLEEIKGFEIGYSGILGRKAYLTVDYYSNEIDNFITDLLPNALGSINPAFGSYTPPAGHPAPSLLLGALAQNLPLQLLAFLSNNVDGTPIFALASYTNAGAVDTQGVDLGLNVYIRPEWVFDFTYSWFDFDITEEAVGGLESNAPEHKFSTGITYNGAKLSASLKFRWVDDFVWSAGAFVGPVDSYSLVDLGGSYRINERVEVGLNISNLFDETHYQSFGGDLIDRRALGNVVFRW